MSALKMVGRPRLVILLFTIDLFVLLSLPGKLIPRCFPYKSIYSANLTENGMKMKCFTSCVLFSPSVFVLFLASALCHQHENELKSCFIDHNVENFTIYPSSHNDPSVYFSFLDFSIQNLRFSGPSVPKPIAIVLPESREQLISSVICCRKGFWEIRVRCGGHSYEGTSYVSNDESPFVLIDVMNLDRVWVDVESETAWVEGGATLGQTYYAISGSSPVLGFSAGSCPTVGIGGHIAGGGFGLLSRKYGLAADNVVDALLIDADGRLLDREAMGEDVFWAIRGGGGGLWGIVYAWKIQLLQVPETVTCFILSRPGPRPHMSKLVDIWQHVAPELGDDFYLSAFVGAGLPQMKKIGLSVTFKGFFLGPKSEAVSILNGVFPELNISQIDCQEMTWIQSIMYFSGLDIHESSVADLNNRFLLDKHYFKAKSDYVRAPISETGLKSAIEILEREPKGYVILDPYGGAMRAISSESIAFPHREGNLYGIQYLVEWHEEHDSESRSYIDWIRGFYKEMTPYVSSGPRAAYINYMDFDLGVTDYLNRSVPAADPVEKARIWGEKYFLKNYDRLVKAKTIIDPFNVFRNQQGIPPSMPAFYRNAKVS
ncbi:reticuline oxidase-like [Dorcoceras hygrometricum]|uniref:Reticuline oxidase-like n=1 Tax=Dorcoceras hygrometricum TaxID=472368 RepID=A0A2Z7BAH5_9LAMI|nr:reticuline oxidase-like [Dorcoceras hygrometricum]